MICLSKTVSNCNWFILQVIESINKMKNNFITNKIIAAKQLLNENVLIIINTTAIKKKLEHDSVWFSIINQAAKINHRKFTVIIHRMHVTALNCSKQKMTIQQFFNQNMHFKNCIKILSTHWFKKALKKSKSNTHLIINMTFLTQINLLISKSLLFHSKLKNCKLFHENCRIT